MDRPEILPEETRWLEWTNVLLSHRWLIVFLGLLFGGVVYGGCKTLNPLYTAETTMLANRFAESRSLTRLVGLNPGRSPEDMADVFSTLFLSSYYMEILRSDVLMQKLVDRTWSNGKTVAEMFEMNDATGDNLRQNALLRLRRSVMEIGQNRSTGMLSIRCTMPDPHVAAEMTNALVGELRKFVAERRTSGTSELVRDAEQRTSEAALALERADKALVSFDRRSKTLISPELRAEREQFLREQELQKETFIKLKSAVVLLRLSEQQRADLIDVIQPAKPPLRKSWPPTRQAAVGAFLFGCVLAVAIAFVRHGIRKMSVAGAPGYEEFAAHLRAMNWYLPGLSLLLPRESRRKSRTSQTGQTSQAGQTLRTEGTPREPNP